MKNPLQQLNDFGQAVWLDYIRRDLLISGELKRMVEEDSLKGVTSNPAIFQKAIAGSTEYDVAIAEAAEKNPGDAERTYETLAIEDIRLAADILRAVYVETEQRDGYVSLEVSPHLAVHCESTIAEARRLWKAVDRENVMIKVPGTDEGAQAIQVLTSEGINVNVTLLFAQEKYQQAAEAYISGLEQRANRGEKLGHVASVASFFISRIDSKVDGWIKDKNNAELNGCLGKVAIANAKLTYDYSKTLYSSPRWKVLEAKGAQKQRLLWASTSTKNPAYRDVLYVEELIGKDTVNTMPPDTLKAFRDHGQLKNGIEESVDAARHIMATLLKEGISFKQATDELLSEAIVLFQQPFDSLLATIKQHLK